ncbi:MAG: RluA family pseudouridine synthase [Flavobacteriales bacterium]|nr:RluA family pseudouridine synthase [Flavobacteriales bacterium]
MSDPSISPAPASSTEPQVLLEDRWLLVLCKPAGMPVQADPTGDPDLLLFARRRHGHGAQLELAHRLDRPVSGVVVLAREGAALVHLHGQFRSRQVKKTYWAVVEGLVAEEGEVELAHALRRDPRAMRARATESDDPNARLRVRVLARGDRFTLLEVCPESGLFHQIRAQLAAWGHPIKGDVKYGARRGERDRSIGLHARALEFTHPGTHEPVRVVAEPPTEGPWPKLLALRR